MRSQTPVRTIGVALGALLTVALALPPTAVAQDPPSPIGPFVIDLRGMLPALGDAEAIAASRGLSVSELPGRGIGLDAGAHIYPLRIGQMTVGLGGRVTLARANRSAVSPLRAVRSRLTSVAPQLSLNFGTGDGWSYLSAGIGVTRWSLLPEGGESQAADTAWVRTMDAGGGARWFAKPRLAFHVDVRVHTIEPGPVQLTLPGAPRIRSMIVSAGVSLKPF